MSKSSQRKISMYQLGKADFNRYYPRYEKSKDYMKGYNSMKPRRIKMKADTAMILFTIVMFIIIVPFLIWGKP